MSDVETIYRNMEEFAEWSDESLRNAIIQNYANNDVELVAANVDRGAKSAITLAMARMRFNGDFASYAQALNNGASLSEYLLKMEAVLHEKKAHGESLSTEQLIHAYTLWWPLLCCLLAGNWGQANRLAQLSRSSVVIEGNVGGIFHSLVELLAACVLDDTARFSANRLVKKPLKEKHPVFAPFILLAQAAMLRDQESFTFQLTALHEDFRLRAKSRTGGLEEYGYGQKNNALCLDFQSIAVCKIASKRGMKITVESEYIPLTLVNYWEL